MIFLGYRNPEKRAEISRYMAEHSLSHCVVLSPDKYKLGDEIESIDWPEIIMYRTFYRLLHEIGPNSLVVVNECLRTRKRSDLTYNCIRHVLAQTDHVMVFQWYPIIEELQDVMN